MSCPWGFVWTGGTCLSTCTSGTTVSSIDPTVCVQVIACPAGSLADTFDNSLCFKTLSTAPPCAANQTLIEGACWTDCPPQFTDQGLSCVKRSFARQTIPPTCGTWSAYENGQCVWTANSWIALLLLLALIVAALWFLFSRMKPPQCPSVQELPVAYTK